MQSLATVVVQVSVAPFIGAPDQPARPGRDTKSPPRSGRARRQEQETTALRPLSSELSLSLYLSEEQYKCYFIYLFIDFITLLC